MPPSLTKIILILKTFLIRLFFLRRQKRRHIFLTQESFYWLKILYLQCRSVISGESNCGRIVLSILKKWVYTKVLRGFSNYMEITLGNFKRRLVAGVLLPGSSAAYFLLCLANYKWLCWLLRFSFFLTLAVSCREQQVFAEPAKPQRTNNINTSCMTAGVIALKAQ